jgi:hypothetical protein
MLEDTAKCVIKTWLRVYIRLAYNGVKVNKERIHLEVVRLGCKKQSSLVRKTANSIPTLISLRWCSTVLL